MVIFTGDQQLTKKSLLRITYAYENEYLLVIINYIIFFINNTWEIILKDLIPINNENNNIYFSIIPINFNRTFYHYLISYVDNRKIKFLYYRFNFQDNNTFICCYENQYNIKNYNYISSDTNSKWIKEYYYKLII